MTSNRATIVLTFQYQSTSDRATRKTTIETSNTAIAPDMDNLPECSASGATFIFGTSRRKLRRARETTQRDVGSCLLAVKTQRWRAVGWGMAESQTILMPKHTGTEYSVRCSNCQKWISCGTVDHSGECLCGSKYNVTFGVDPNFNRVAKDLKEGRLKRGTVCLDCGELMIMQPLMSPPNAGGWSKRLPSPGTYKQLKTGQIQCSKCRQDAKSRGK